MLYFLAHISFIICIVIAFLSLQSSINIIKDIYIYTGLFSLYFFSVSLIVAIIIYLFNSLNKDSTFIKYFGKFPKICGNYALFFGLMHFTNFIYLDSGFSFKFIIKEIKEKSFLLYGFLGLFSMASVFITSNLYSKKFINKFFRNFSYLGFFAVSIHFFMSKKVPSILEYLFLILGSVLLLIKVILIIKSIRKYKFRY